MVLSAWCSSEAALQSCHECALSQFGTQPDMTLDVARIENNNKHTNTPNMKHYVPPGPVTPSPMVEAAVSW